MQHGEEVVLPKYIGDKLLLSHILNIVLIEKFNEIAILKYANPAVPATEGITEAVIDTGRNVFPRRLWIAKKPASATAFQRFPALGQYGNGLFCFAEALL
jgi:hypothetical protein